MTARRCVVNVRVAVRAHAAVRRSGAHRQAVRARGLTVVGVPCNQFGAQEPGSAAEISAPSARRRTASRSRCWRRPRSTGPTGTRSSPTLTEVEDADGYTGDVRWNFEKWVIAADGTVVARFAPKTDPEAPEVLAALDHALA